MDAPTWPKTRAGCIGITAFWSFFEILWIWGLFQGEPWYWQVIRTLAIIIGFFCIYSAIRRYRELP